MRTETITRIIYKYDELPTEKAKETARDWWRDGEHYSWNAEYFDSLRKFCDVLNIKIADWGIDYYNPGASYVKFRYDFQDAEDLSGLRLRTWIINNWLPKFAQGKYYSTKGHHDTNGKYYHKSRHSKIFIEYDNCPLTGFVGDISLIQPILDFIKKPDSRDLEDILYACKENFISEFCSDMQSQDEDEYVADTITANEYEFTEDGKFYH